MKPASLEPYPGPFLEPGLLRRIRLTAWMRSFGRPDKKAYRLAAKAATGAASAYAEANCAKYFEFQYVWPSHESFGKRSAAFRGAGALAMLRAQDVAAAAPSAAAAAANVPTGARAAADVAAEVVADKALLARPAQPPRPPRPLAMSRRPDPCRTGISMPE
ncbi:MAG: hypothetical protein ACLUE1_04465 [Adlercreutzia equolifaciens]